MTATTSIDLADRLPRGISVATLVRLDTRDAGIRTVWDADPAATSSDKRCARVVIDSLRTPYADGPIYVIGESLDGIADWFENAARKIRQAGDPA